MRSRVAEGGCGVCGLGGGVQRSGLRGSGGGSDGNRGARCCCRDRGGRCGGGDRARGARPRSSAARRGAPPSGYTGHSLRHRALLAPRHKVLWDGNLIPETRVISTAKCIADNPGDIQRIYIHENFRMSGSDPCINESDVNTFVSLFVFLALFWDSTFSICRFLT